MTVARRDCKFHESGPLRIPKKLEMSPFQTSVPFLDLTVQHASLAAELEPAVRGILEGGVFVLGPAVEAFEGDFAAYLGARECVGVNSGTAALQLALMGVGLEPGGEVLIPANTFVATAEAVIWAGGVPVLVDVRDEDANMDPAAVRAAITPRTQGIVPVHLYGRMAAILELGEIARAHGLFLVEDACQAHGAAASGRKAGTFGAAAAFSFYPGKNLGAYGEGGAVVTHDPEIARKVRMLRDHGQIRKYEHAVLGHNFRMDALQGAVLGVKLRHLDRWNDARRRVCGWYREDLRGTRVRLNLPAPVEEDVHHLFVIRAPERDTLRGHLQEKRIATLIHYPVPLHRQTALSPWIRASRFPVTEILAGEIVSLPLYPELTRETVHRISEAVTAFCAAEPERATR